MRAIVAAVFLMTTSALAQTPTNMTPEKRAEARQHYMNGLRKFDVAKFDEAAAEFVAAYEIAGDASILYNIAQSYRLGERHEKALFFYKAFQRHLEPKSPLRAEVEKRITELTQAVDESKHASTAPPTGTIKSEHLGGGESKPPETAKPPEPKPTVVATAKPPEPKPVATSKPPEPKPTVVATSKPPEPKPTVVATSKPPEPKPEKKPEKKPEPKPVKTVVIEKKPETKPEPKPAGGPSPTLKYAGIALAVVAVAGIAVGAGMSGAAGQDSSNLESASKQRVAFGPNLQSSEKNGQLYDTLSYVFYGVGGAAAVAAAVTLYFGLRPAPSARAQLTPIVGPNQAGLLVTGRF